MATSKSAAAPCCRIFAVKSAEEAVNTASLPISPNCRSSFPASAAPITRKRPAWNFRQMIRELQPTCGVFIAMVNWWNCLDLKSYYDAPGDHAGELETSVMLEIAPDLMLPLSDAGHGKAKKFKIDGLRSGLAWAPRTWTKVTEDTGSGDPSRATRDKGVRHLEAVTTAIADFLVQLAEAETPDSYE